LSGKRILLTATSELAYDQRMQRICTALAGAGHRVRLIGRQRKSSPTLNAQPYEQVRLRCFFEKGKLFYLEFNLRLLGYLLTHRFDALCAVDLDTLGPCLVAARLKGRPLVYDAHEYFTEVPEVVGRPSVKRAWEMLGRLLIPRLRFAYTVGPELARVLGERYGVPFGSIRNVPYSLPTPPLLPDGPRVILYQGMLNEGRGLERAIQAMHHVEGAQLWLAGEGDLSDQLRALCQQEGLEHKVRFLGLLSPTELRSLTTRAYIGLNLLDKKGLSYYYSLANKFFDYLQAGVPSLNPDFPEYQAILSAHDIGWTFPENGSAETLGAFLQTVLANPDLRARKSEQCALVRGSFCWEKESEILLKFWEQVWVSDGKK
jgi:glycosyltransferase involved in cell wall biosynthesis